MDIVNVKIDGFVKWQYCCHGALAIMKADHIIDQQSIVHVSKVNGIYLSSFCICIKSKTIMVRISIMQKGLILAPEEYLIRFIINNIRFEINRQLGI